MFHKMLGFFKFHFSFCCQCYKFTTELIMVKEEKNFNIEVVRAVEPSDIIWENCGV